MCGCACVNVLWVCMHVYVLCMWYIHACLHAQLCVLWCTILCYYIKFKSIFISFNLLVSVSLDTVCIPNKSHWMEVALYCLFRVSHHRTVVYITTIKPSHTCQGEAISLWSALCVGDLCACGAGWWLHSVTTSWLQTLWIL